MKWKFAFGLASDDLFFVTTRREEPARPGYQAKSKITTFQHEDEFLELVIRAGLPEEETTRLALAVLMSVAKPTLPPVWTEVELTQNQMETLCLGRPNGGDVPAAAGGRDRYLEAARAGSLPQFYDLLMQVPTAIAMLLGREHRFAFVNERYLNLMGMGSSRGVLGKTVVELFPELRDQQFVEILDRVYATGNPWVGRERPCSFYRATIGAVKEGYFDSVFQPITDAFGDVAGIMIQITDVTELVLARAVREHRERLLYRQWAELEAIYRSAPIGLLLIDTKDFRILRVNEREAERIGGRPSSLLGKPLLEAMRHNTGMRRLLERVMLGEPIANQMHFSEAASSPGVRRCWLVNYAPTYSADGRVEAITAVSLDVTREARAEVDDFGTEQFVISK